MIYVDVVPREGPHGDRATTSTPYFDYEIRTNEEVIFKISGYSGFHSIVKPLGEARREAEVLASKLSRAMHSDVIWSDQDRSERWTISFETTIMARDLDDAREQMAGMMDNGTIVPHIYKKRTR